MKAENRKSSLQATFNSEAIDRRTLLARAGAIAALGSIATVSGMAAAQEDGEKSWDANEPLIEAALECAKESEACMAHCISTFKDGSTMLAACSGLVQETIITCTALAKMAAYGSNQLNDMARLSIASCEECETECQRHASHHEECKACADSCRACIRACKAHLG